MNSTGISPAFANIPALASIPALAGLAKMPMVPNMMPMGMPGRPMPQITTRVLILMNMVVEEELKDDDEYEG